MKEFKILLIIYMILSLLFAIGFYGLIGDFQKSTKFYNTFSNSFVSLFLIFLYYRYGKKLYDMEASKYNIANHICLYVFYRQI